LLPFVLYIASSGTFKNSRKGYIEISIIAISFTLGQLIASVFIGPELVSVMAALFSLIAYSLYASMRRKIETDGLFQSTLQYSLLLVFAIVALIFKDYLKFNIIYGSFSVNPITTAGTLFLLSIMISIFILKTEWKIVKDSLYLTLLKLRFSAITIISIVVLAKFLTVSGAIDIIAISLIAATGIYYPFFAPIIGALGTFITGSDTSSNILFGKLQAETAYSLGGNTEWLVASNTSGATAGKMISPQSISLASSALDIKEESSLMRTMLPYCIIYLLIIGVIVFAFF
jgi:lactate permease